MKRCLAALLFFLASAAPAAAQNAAAVTEGHYLQGQFRQQRFMKGFDAPLESRGRFTLAPGHGLLWQAEMPFAATTIIGPAGMVQEVRGVETMRLSAARAAFVARTFEILGGALGGHWHRLEDSFEVSRKQHEGGWELALSPRRATEPELPFRRIVIRGTRFADIVEMEKTNGDRDVLTFRDQQLLTAPLPADAHEKFSTLEHR